MKDFSLFDRVPVAMQKVLSTSSSKYIDKMDILNGQHYQNGKQEGESSSLIYSVGSYMAGAVYSNTLGYLIGSGSTEDEEKETVSEYVNVEMLD